MKFAASENSSLANYHIVIMKIHLIADSVVIEIFYMINPMILALRTFLYYAVFYGTAYLTGTFCVKTTFAHSFIRI